MKKPPGVHVVKRKHSTTYYFRRRIPGDLADFYPEGWITEKLPASQADAYVRAAAKWAETDAEFEQLRATGSRFRPALTDAEKVFIAESVRHELLDADDEHWRFRPDELSDEAYGYQLSDLFDDVDAALVASAPMSRDLQRRLQASLEGLGVQLDPRGDEFRDVARAYLLAVKGALKDIARRRAGTANPPTPPQPQPPKKARAQTEGERLGDLIDYWARYGDQKREKSIEEGRAAARRFVAVVGDLPLQSIEKAHFIAFRDDRLKTVSGKTVKKDVSLLAAAFNVALADDKFGLKVNPADHLRIPLGESKKRGQFSAGQLKTIFESPVFTKGARPEGGKGDTAFWLPLVALFTGARLTEAASIRLDEIGSADGIHFIHFRHDPATGRVLKANASGNKRVPIHSELVRLGLLDRVKALRKAGETRLFPELWRGKVKDPAHKWGDWWRRYLDGLGLDQEGLGAHAFRHTFVYLLRQAGVPEDQRNALTGHADKSVSARYGALEGYPLGPLKEAVEKLRPLAGLARPLTVPPPASGP
ncbi:MAG: site-specific integrase [Burkholderiaceae bacterium]|nr:site-specific integrase [Burkholderiaceae bacterium]